MRGGMDWSVGLLHCCAIVALAPVCRIKVGRLWWCALGQSCTAWCGFEFTRLLGHQVGTNWSSMSCFKNQQLESSARAPAACQRNSLLLFRGCRYFTAGVQQYWWQGRAEGLWWDSAHYSPQRCSVKFPNHLHCVPSGKKGQKTTKFVINFTDDFH